MQFLNLSTYNILWFSPVVYFDMFLFATTLKTLLHKAIDENIKIYGHSACSAAFFILWLISIISKYHFDAMSCKEIQFDEQWKWEKSTPLYFISFHLVQYLNLALIQ